MNRNHATMFTLAELESVMPLLQAHTGVEVVVKHEKPHADRGFQGARSSCPLAESTDLAFPV